MCPYLWPKSWCIIWTLEVVKWSAGLPSSMMIQVRILLFTLQMYNFGTTRIKWQPASWCKKYSSTFDETRQQQQQLPATSGKHLTTYKENIFVLTQAGTSKDFFSTYKLKAVHFCAPILSENNIITLHLLPLLWRPRFGPFCHKMRLFNFQSRPLFLYFRFFNSWQKINYIKL